ncbi:sugar transferase [Erythrobacter sp. SD-21]|uniref:sugar transferase n=1 Tax=Erythrobacter sp. SD-21 TaxID=161528 RepID=UPI000153F350|nr:sugar transferase [Erythrobacter sp. SD-21]EDL50159.1 probable glycosyl transferase [Erythrobacter sp. SD-21]
MPLKDFIEQNRRPAMEHRRIQLYAALFLIDIGTLFASFWLSGAIYVGRMPSLRAIQVMQFTIPIFVIIAIYNRLYSIQTLESFRHALWRLSLTLGLSAMLFLVMTFYVGSSTDFARLTFSTAVIMAFLAMIVVRAFFYWYVKRNFRGRISNVLIIEDGGPFIDLPGVDRVEADGEMVEQAHSDPEALDLLGRTMRGMDRVIVSCPVDRRKFWTRIMRASGVHGEVVSEALQELGALALEREHGWSFLVVSAGPLGLRARLTKRVIDLAFTVPALILLGPLMLVVALLIKLEDGGPVFFVQPRMGQGNCMFDMLKFRSMKVGKLDAEGARSTSREDDRVTRIGKFIRRTSIDELPQLLNVLRSEMSLVGPRPHALGSLANEKLFWEIDSNYWQRHSLKPGLTGLAQVRGFRGATETEMHLTDRLGADLEYIRHWSPLGDLKIIFATAKVLVHPNAY